MTRPRMMAVVAVLLGLTGIAFAQSAIQSTPARRSGFDDMRPATQAMQRDDSQNPAMLWLLDGEALWNQPPGNGGKACVTCHASAQSSMRGVAARYPAFDAMLGRPVNLAHRINLCRERHQYATPWPPESPALLGLEALVAHPSRGQPIAPPDDPRLTAFRLRGEKLFSQRMGQINMSCAHCHDHNSGQRLGGSTIPQGHPTGYPIYRLEWQTLGSLTRRLRGCMTGVRAEPFGAHSVEMVELELYLASRAMGMPIETPGVRP